LNRSRMRRGASKDFLESNGDLLNVLGLLPLLVLNDSGVKPALR